MKNHLAIYNSIKKRIKAFEYANFIINWDHETEAPKNSIDYRSEQIKVLTEELYKLTSNNEYIDSIEYLYKNIELIKDELLKVEIKKQHKELRMIKRIPKDEYIAYQVLIQTSSAIWAEAKEKNDFSLLEPVLDKIFKTWRKFIKYLETETLKGYDILLDMYEEGFNTKKYDDFFKSLKDELVPFVLEVTKSQKYKFNKKLKKSVYPKEKQREFALYLINVFGYNLDSGVLKESLHPFTFGVSATDTRITTNYYINNISSSIFSIAHEVGHAIYEQQNDLMFENTFLHGAPSLGIHESQSRLYENMIARSYAFWETHYHKLVELFPKQLKGIDVLEFYRFINQAKRSVIRSEADELTYSLHIMVRYELEKELINGTLKVKDLPRKWKQLMSKYVGKRPTTDKEGVLQDMHWSIGYIGYFPTYALGSAYAAQIYKAMNEELNIESIIENNHIKKINEWLKNKIHQFGALKTPDELIKNATGEEFNSKYYIEYLKRKYR